MDVDTISDWIKFVEPSPSSPGGISPADIPTSTSVFGLYAQRLRDDIFNYLVVTLPTALEVPSASPVEPSTQASGRDTLLQVFSLVPFDMFKTAVESPSFQIGMPIVLHAVVG